MKLSEAWVRLAKYFDGLRDASGRVPFGRGGGPWLCNNIIDAGCREHYAVMQDRIDLDIKAMAGPHSTYDTSLTGYNDPDDNAARVLVLSHVRVGSGGCGTRSARTQSGIGCGGGARVCMSCYG